ncbi:MAG: hypothetical protein HOD92_26710 [Deltaproteobacteria bacterium]|jgi:hypothetical protein|nr:hypothetical protein [Deltaproteobacteria bacterium]
MKKNITSRQAQDILQSASSFTLSKYNCSEKIRVISLGEDKWRMLAEDLSRLDNTTYDDFGNMLEKLDDEQYKSKIKREFQKNIVNLDIQQVDPVAYKEAMKKNASLLKNIEDFIDKEKIVQTEYANLLI